MISIDVTFLYIIVVFLLAFRILKRYLFGPLLGILKEREAGEKAAQEAHAESLEKLSRTVAEAEQKLSLARREALKTREGLRAEGLARLEEKLAQARAASDAAVASGVGQIERQSKTSANELPGEARRLARDLAEKILGRKLAA